MKEGPDLNRRGLILGAAALAATALESTDAEAQTRTTQEQATMNQKPAWERLQLTKEEYEKTVAVRDVVSKKFSETIIPFLRKLNTGNSKAYADFFEKARRGEAGEPTTGALVAEFRELFSFYDDNPVDAHPVRALSHATNVLSHVGGLITKEAANIRATGLNAEAEQIRTHLNDARNKLRDISHPKPARK